ncbi:MAG: flagellar hook assembly protein FlgD [Pseudomonadota bacterium]|nr:flagellar hook assembly protein FlgD [Pseudomonadota bacterium]MDP1905421.1 flagellar hook assembly protein FlgD [Pseudomonadota bacterium]MDP2352909.1 flagellar hook assembly protein FlgD [Pseudomonadota bacterium]
MATIAATDNAALAAQLSGTKTTTAADTAAELSDRFLKLLVTQLKNQDPMSPMENAELTSQLAQMSTVEGVNKLNTSMDGMLTQMRATQALQGASLIGRQVLAEGDLLALGAAGAAGGVNLASTADSLKIDILDAAGGVVRSLDLGAQPAGLTRFGWDGQDSAGNALTEGFYSYKATASAAGKSVDATQYSLAEVLSVSLASSGVDVELNGLGNLGLDKIKQIF